LSDAALRRRPTSALTAAAGADGHLHATLLRMTMKDLASLVAVVVGMLLVLVTP